MARPPSPMTPKNAIACITVPPPLLALAKVGKIPPPSPPQIQPDLSLGTAVTGCIGGVGFGFRKLQPDSQLGDLGDLGGAVKRSVVVDYAFNSWWGWMLG